MPSSFQSILYLLGAWQHVLSLLSGVGLGVFRRKYKNKTKYQIIKIQKCQPPILKINKKMSCESCDFRRHAQISFNQKYHYIHLPVNRQLSTVRGILLLAAQTL